MDGLVSFSGISIRKYDSMSPSTGSIATFIEETLVVIFQFSIDGMSSKN